jgi:hypothetical protein
LTKAWEHGRRSSALPAVELPGGDVMSLRLLCCAALMVAAFVPNVARAGCAEEISRLMSRDTEKLTTRFNRVSKRIENEGRNPRLVAEECRIARQLRPRLEDQLSALKQSNCSKDPQVAAMIADIVRGHEDDLAVMRKTTARAECR